MPKWMSVLYKLILNNGVKVDHFLLGRRIESQNEYVLLYTFTKYKEANYLWELHTIQDYLNSLRK